ncbi:fungal-specific transcription factor domain-containing protein [Phialemonium atrogriseum]|uniref:Fungal-specific transcription factor domain-containing protein n=1 Tax=Phialemonium atrogriseum TaxID=1093897 RepID=A0AAJ0BPS3_9PEZI|nr:fungal-specific transcription factor domain-containing protein [Phialemonium atrogriseum]KAK1762061.1 fungal-specific transcription factor domain-containing protein [Phialemonium atrogriseum]
MAEDSDRGSSAAGSPHSAHLPPKKNTRSRTGCLNCRKRKRKCDEGRPACVACSRRNETCEWGIKVTFRDENAFSIVRDHRSMTRGSRKRPRSYEITDVTDEVSRSYHQPSPSNTSFNYFEASPEPLINAPSNSQYAASLAYGHVSPERSSLSSATAPGPLFSHAHLPKPAAARLSSSIPHPQFQSSPSPSIPTESAVATLMSLSRGSPGNQNQATTVSCPAQPTAFPNNNNIHPSPGIQGYIDQLPSPEGSYDDGIFRPGSVYHELHSTLRNHLIHEVRSSGPTRPGTPALESQGRAPRETADVDALNSAEPPSAAEWPASLSDDNEAPALSQEEECLLWKNWIEEISPWVDKFDSQRHFLHSLLPMARSNKHLKYSMLALSARQLERKDPSLPTDRSLALYQQAIHLLLPLLHTRTTAVIASCVVLCVLEMLSCSPKAWRRHLDGCASLMQAVGINGFVGGVEQALFWCFARMDVCGGLISSVKTLIPVGSWATKIDLDADVGLLRSTKGFDMCANHVVYLVAQVLDLLAPSVNAPHGVTVGIEPRTDQPFKTRWLKLWRHLQDWHDRRPPEMHNVMSIPSSDSSPFPTILYSNPAAISGNQLYHTGSILMLQNMPVSLRLTPRPKSILWHARRVCGISITNHHHGAWTNSIQPLWIAGRCMSHPSEHRAILEVLSKIQRESGWAAEWRADDLKEFWGELSD